jgi:hypothetical protein
MIAFYIMGLSMKTLRNARFANSTDSIIENMVVMKRTATEPKEKSGLKRCFDTFLSFTVLSIGLQTRSQNCCDCTKRSIHEMLE